MRLDLVRIRGLKGRWVGHNSCERCDSVEFPGVDEEGCACLRSWEVVRFASGVVPTWTLSTTVFLLGLLKL